MREILEKLAKGQITIDDAEHALRLNEIGKLSNFARLDIGRERRRGIPEIVFAEGKNNKQLEAICDKMLECNRRVIVSRLDEEQTRRLAARYKPPNVVVKFPHAKSIVIKSPNYNSPQTDGRIGILTAGTVDLGVAEEAAMIAQEMGCQTFLESDAGVAGIHRLVEPLGGMIKKDVDCLVVVAGREGALPTVVAGLVDVPIIALPSSSGYGYGGRGEAALMAMLQACSLGLAVVNIDAGIAAGIVAAQIANRAARARKGIGSGVRRTTSTRA